VGRPRRRDILPRRKRERRRRARARVHGTGGRREKESGEGPFRNERCGLRHRKQFHLEGERASRAASTREHVGGCPIAYRLPSRVPRAFTILTRAKPLHSLLSLPSTSLVGSFVESCDGRLRRSRSRPNSLDSICERERLNLTQVERDRQGFIRE